MPLALLSALESVPVGCAILFVYTLKLMSRLRLDYAVTQKRLAKEAKEREKSGAGGVDAPLPVSPLPKGRSREDNDGIFRIRCRDNGRGMPHDEIPNMLGKVLSSTNYCLRQTRGKYGLGAKMALIWSKMSTSQPIEVESAQRGAGFVSRYTLDIDIKRNAPIIIKEEKAPIDLQGADAAGPWHGAELIVTIKGNWKTYGHRVLSYFRQLAVITPYAQLGLQFRALVRARGDVAGMTNEIS